MSIVVVEGDVMATHSHIRVHPWEINTRAKRSARRAVVRGCEMMRVMATVVFGGCVTCASGAWTASVVLAISVSQSTITRVRRSKRGS